MNPIRPLRPRTALWLAALCTAVATPPLTAQQPTGRGPAAGRGVRAPAAQEPTPPQEPTTTQDPTTPQDPPAAADPPATTGRVDRELVLDAGALTSVYRDAMQPLQDTLSDNTLQQRYAALAGMLQSEQVDGPALLDALRALRQELDSVVDRLPGVADSLWDGTENLAFRIDEFRRDLARGLDRKAGLDAPQDRGDDLLLRDLADRILELPEGNQQRRILEQRFEAMSLLFDRARQVTDQLAGADGKVLRHILGFLIEIRASLHVAALRTTELSIAMQHQQQLVSRFEVLIENLIATDRLADTIEELTRASAPSFGELTEHMETLTSGLLGYADQLDQRAAEVANSLNPRLSAAIGGASGTAAEGGETRPVLPRSELLQRIRAAASPDARGDAAPTPGDATPGDRLPDRDR